ncbi:MAG: ribbon-helix-helix protein, CopG family [Clostridia bacterium]|nr:ribbon-helix-helix protein, CopG family [Clostridia bacterium]
MAEKKLVIKPHRFGGETTVISLRLPKEMLAVIDQAATDTGRTRNEILLLSMEFALENMDINEK